MSTTQIAAALYQLQQLDFELERILNEQQIVATSLQGNAALQQLRAEQKTAQEQLQSALQAQRDAEWALEDLGRRLKAQQQRLYSGVVKNPKELNALEQEILHLRLQHDKQEEKTLEAMDAAESVLHFLRTAMTSTFAAVATGITTFVATNIDDLVLLTLFFARRIQPRRIVAGQYLGFSTILLVSLLGAWAAVAIPHRWVRLLGVLPLVLGLKELLLGRRAESVNAGVKTTASFPSLLSLSPMERITSMFTFLYLPSAEPTFGFAGSLLGNHPTVMSLVDRWGHRVTPLVFIALGTYILVFS